MPEYPYGAVGKSTYKPPPGQSFGFKQGEQVTVLGAADDDGDWLNGRNEKGDEGVFPASFVDAVVAAEASEAVEKPAVTDEAPAPTPPAVAAAAPPTEPASEPTKTAPPPARKPGGLRDRIAAFNQPSAAPSAPPIKPPKPAGGLTWSQRQALAQAEAANKPPAAAAAAAASPSASPIITPAAVPAVSPGAAATAAEEERAAFSAADAQASIAQAGSLKDRIKALQGLEAKEVKPPPPVKPAGKPWKRPSVPVPEPEEEDDAEGAEAPEKKKTLSPAASVAAIPLVSPSGESISSLGAGGEPSTTMEDPTPAAAPEGEPEEEEDEEAAKRSALAKRMAALGGRSVTMPALPRRAGPPRKPKAAAAAAPVPAEDEVEAPLAEAEKEKEADEEEKMGISEPEPPVESEETPVAPIAAQKEPEAEEEDEFETPALPAASTTADEDEEPEPEAEEPQATTPAVTTGGVGTPAELVDFAKAESHDVVDDELLFGAPTAPKDAPEPEPEDEDAVPASSQYSAPIDPVELEQVLHAKEEEEASSQPVPPPFAASGAPTPELPALAAGGEEVEPELPVPTPEAEEPAPVEEESEAPPAIAMRSPKPPLPPSFVAPPLQDEAEATPSPPPPTRQPSLPPPTRQVSLPPTRQVTLPPHAESPLQDSIDRTLQADVEEEGGEHPTLHREDEAGVAEARDVEDAPLPQEELDRSTPAQPVAAAEPDEEEEEEEEEDPEVARRAALAQRMAKLGGMKMGLFPGPPPMAGGAKKKVVKRQASAASGTSVDEVTESPKEEKRDLPPPGAFRLPAIVPKVPTKSEHPVEEIIEASADSPPSLPPAPLPQTSILTAISSDDAPPPLPAGRPPQPPQQASDDGPPPLPKSGPPPSRAVPIPVPAAFADDELEPETEPEQEEEPQVEEEVEEEQEPVIDPAEPLTEEPEEHASASAPPARAPPPPGVASDALPAGRGSIDSNRSFELYEPATPAAPGGGFKAAEVELELGTGWWKQRPFTAPASVAGRRDVAVDVTESTTTKRGKTRYQFEIELVYDDLSKTIVELSYANADDEPQVSQEHSPPPPAPSAGDLQQFSSTTGTQIFAAARSKLNDKAKVTQDELVEFCFSKATDPLQPIGYVFGIAALSVQIVQGPKGKPVPQVQELDQPRAGDIAVIWAGKFKQKLSTTKLGTADKPHVAVVESFDAGKKKLLLIEADPKTGTAQENSVKVEDMRSGAIFVYRPLPRSILD